MRRAILVPPPVIGEDFTCRKRRPPLRKDLAAVKRDEEGVLELGRQGPVFGYSRPIVVQDFHLPSPDVDHWLYGEGHAWLHSGASPPLADVADLRIFMKAAPNPVAHELANNGAALGLREFLNSCTDVT